MSHKDSDITRSLLYSKDYNIILPLIHLIKSKQSLTQIKQSLNNLLTLADTHISCILIFALSSNYPLIFDIVKESYPTIFDSILISLEMNTNEFSYQLLAKDVSKRALLFNNVLTELLKGENRELVLQLIELNDQVIYEETITSLIQVNDLLLINKLLQTSNTLLAISKEFTEESLEPITVFTVFSRILEHSKSDLIFQFINENQVKVNDKLLNEIAKKGRFKVIDLLGKYENPTKFTLLHALKHNNFEYLLTNFSYFTDYIASGTSPKLLKQLVKSCNSFEDIEVKLYALNKSYWYIEKEQAIEVFDVYGSAIMDGLRERPNVFDYTHNPIKVAVLLIEVLLNIAEKYKIMKVYCEEIKQKLMEYISSLSETITNEESLRLLYLEEDFEGREVLFIIKELKLYTLLENKQMKLLVETLWDSNYVLDGNFMIASHIFTLLADWPLNSKIDIESETRFQPKDIHTLPHNRYNFNVWKRAISMKYMTQAIIYFILAVFFQTLMYFFLNAAELYSDEDEKQAIEAYNDLWLFLKCSVVWFILPAKMIFDYTFRIRAKRKYSFLTGEVFVLLVQVVCTILLFTEFFRMKEMCQEKEGEEFYDCFHLNFFDESGYLKEVLSIMMLCIWLRVIISLTVTKIVGPIITASFLLIKDLLQFFLLFGLINVALGTFANLILVRIEGFQTPGQTMFTLSLFSTLMATVDIPEDLDNRHKIYAEAFIMFYMFISGVVLIDLLIAIFEETYYGIEDQAKAICLSYTISLRPVYKYDKRYSYYVSAQFPFTVVLVSVLPFVMFYNQPEIVNQFMLHIEYLPFMLSCFFVFFTLNLILLPFTFMKVLFHKLILICKANKSTTIHKIGSFLLYLCFGLLFLIYQLFADCIAFIRHLYSNNLEKQFKDQRVIDDFKPSTLIDYLKFIKQIKENEMSIDELFAKYEKEHNLIFDKKVQDNIEVLKHILSTLEVAKNKEKYIKIEVAYCLLKSILKTSKYFELRKGGRRHKGKYVKKRAIIKNINRRIVCQQDEIEGKEIS